MGSGTTHISTGSAVKRGRAAELLQRRQEVSEIDQAILHLIGHRIGLVRQIWKIKQETGLPEVDADQEYRVLSRVARWADAEHIDPAFARALWEEIVAEGKRLAHAEAASTEVDRSRRRRSGTGRPVPPKPSRKRPKESSSPRSRPTP